MTIYVKNYFSHPSRLHKGKLLFMVRTLRRVRILCVPQCNDDCTVKWIKIAPTSINPTYRIIDGWVARMKCVPYKGMFSIA